ncbi:hypothetical protein J4477_00130 [Candidatus Pacearchaeota archaeon]|nr:hypothetical protein [Candidatus Pacearchaeota archaeon]
MRNVSQPRELLISEENVDALVNKGLFYERVYQIILRYFPGEKIKHINNSTENRRSDSYGH